MTVLHTVAAFTLSPNRILPGYTRNRRESWPSVGAKTDQNDDPSQANDTQGTMTMTEDFALIRDNAGNLSLRFDIKPPAPREHIVQLLMDGEVQLEVKGKVKLKGR